MGGFEPSYKVNGEKKIKISCKDQEIMSFYINFFLTIFAFFISNKLIKLFILKLKEKFIDIPNFRSMHITPTPRGGGIIFVFITISSSIFYLIFNGYSNIYIIPVLCIPFSYN